MSNKPKHATDSKRELEDLARFHFKTTDHARIMVMQLLEGLADMGKTMPVTQAQEIVVHLYGCQSWSALVRLVETAASPPINSERAPSQDKKRKT